jgi:hypothetical protein
MESDSSKDKNIKKKSFTFHVSDEDHEKIKEIVGDYKREMEEMGLPGRVSISSIIMHYIKTDYKKRFPEKELDKMPRSRKLPPGEILGIVRKACDRISYIRDKKTLEIVLLRMIESGSLPVRSLECLPIPSSISGKSRLDQIYEMCIAWKFPPYREGTSMLISSDRSIRFWKIIFPKRMKSPSILVKAKTYQEAFGMACDYSCRFSLFMTGKIPTDLTVRVKSVSDEEALKMGLLRKMNRKKSSSGSRHMYGIRVCAIGPKSGSDYSLFKYMELQDLKSIRVKRGETRISSVDSEFKDNQ